MAGLYPNLIEPQNTEQGIMNVEGLMIKELLTSAFPVRYSIFKKVVNDTELHEIALRPMINNVCPQLLSTNLLHA
jgi:hypothetical protein